MRRLLLKTCMLLALTTVCFLNTASAAETAVSAQTEQVSGATPAPAASPVPTDTTKQQKAQEKKPGKNDQPVDDQAEKVDLLDSLISALMLLFILSVMVEKITQLIRSYGPNSRISRFFSRFRRTRSVWANIGKGKQHESEEAKRKAEREIAMLSLILGITMAATFKIDLFAMFKRNDPTESIFWSSGRPDNFLDWASLCFSFIATGFFLSFGSKFFHDLIDTLLQIKNLKRKMADENTYKAETIEEFDHYLEQSYSDIIEKAINQNPDAFKHPEATSPPMHGRMRENGRLVDCIDLHISGNSRGKIPEFVLADLGTGKKVKVAVNVIYGVDTPVAMSGASSVYHPKYGAAKGGTICCRLNVDNEVRLLTCSHVMKGGSNDNSFGNLSTPEQAVIDGQPDGSFVWASRTRQLDIALIKPATAFSEVSPNTRTPRKVMLADLYSTQVRVACKSGDKTGRIINITNNPITIHYNGKPTDLTGLIVLSNDSSGNYKGITVGGDSGACVYTEEGTPIGMIVAGGSRFSYAIPLTTITAELSATIVV